MALARTGAQHPPVRSAIIGAGLMGRWHMASALHAGVRPAFVVDRNPAAAADLARRAPGSLVARDLAQVLQEIDVAHVCTPAETHAEIVAQLLAAGVHVLVEKPLGVDAHEVELLVREAAARNLQLCPVHQYAFQDGLQQAVADLPRIGPLRRIDFDLCSAGAVGAFAGRPDDVVAEILPHPLSILQKLVPGFDLATARWTVVRGEAGEMLASTGLGPILVSLFLSLHARPTCFRTRLQGDAGAVEVDGFQGGAIRLSGEVSRVRKLTSPFERGGKLLLAGSRTLAGRALSGETAYPGLRALVRRFYDAVAGGEAPLSLDETLAAAQARDQLMRLFAKSAAAEGCSHG
jgi:predicted dehydrogenase